MSAVLTWEKLTRLSPTALVSEGRAREGRREERCLAWRQKAQPEWKQEVGAAVSAEVGGAGLWGAKGVRPAGRVGSGHPGQGRRPSPVLFQSWEG